MPVRAPTRIARHELRRGSHAFVAAVAALLLAVPALAGTFEDMVALDRAYIPALALTNQSNPAASKRAIDTLRGEWNRFRQAYAQPPAGFKPDTWNRATATVERAVTEAEARMAAGKSAGAHEALEEVREVLLAARREAGMPHFMDELTEYPTHMEAIVTTVTGKNALTLSADDRAQIVPRANAIRPLFSRLFVSFGDFRRGA
jgi:hypothetical protein